MMTGCRKRAGMECVGGRMGKWMRRAVMLALLAVFLVSAVTVGKILYEYYVSGRLYDNAAAQYTALASGEGAGENGDAKTGKTDGGGVEQPGGETAPVKVDFSGLQAVNSDIAGWIYCEDTSINYPVVKGEDNDFYLDHGYEGTESSSGAIFIEAGNRPDFQDANTIIYGHHMKNGSMFASLEKWADQEYYGQHPHMWLLTPGQDYKIVLFSGYTTGAESETYTIFSDSCREFDEYLEVCVSRSDFRSEAVPEGGAKCVLLSTCSYVFEDARYVLHGMLVPVDSAGGVPFPAAGGQ